MKIVDVRAVLLSHPYPSRDGLEWVGGYISSWDAALVEVVTDEGVRGVGEVAQGIMGAPAVPGIVDGLKPYVVGRDPRRVTDVRDRLYDQTVFWARGGIATGVIGAIEIALWDILGKIHGLPVYQLLGGLAHDRLPLYASGGLGTSIDQIVEFATTAEANQFPAVKVRGIRTPEESIAVARAVRDAIRPETGLVLDAVQGCASRPWPVKSAVRVGQALGELPNILWFEEPCRAENVGGYAEVRRRVDLPISGVESYATRFEFAHLLDADGVDILQPDAAMVGGISEVQRIAAMAATRFHTVILHTWGTGVTVMANLHAALATPNIPMVEYCQISNPLREVLLAEPLTVEAGHVLPPPGPGLGVALTPAIEREFPFLPGRGHVIF